ncbi:MAG: GNAT family N-acetyltransferase [Aureibaculum sp.]|nr:GNAT family N-acetyltransferase [Aureibaculum sp.]
MGFIIRYGERRDMSSVLKLVNELAVFEKEPNAVKVTVDDLIGNGFKDNPAFLTFVAELEGVIVGMALFYNRFSTWEGPSLHLEDLIVTEKFRGKGIGKALYDKVLDFALQKGIKRVEWVVLDWNEPAITFYKSTGAIMLEDWNICQINNQSIVKYLQKK